MEDLISVIMSTYNVVDYIEEVVNSFLNQTYRNLELIIVDDASTDCLPLQMKKALRQAKKSYWQGGHLQSDGGRSKRCCGALRYPYHELLYQTAYREVIKLCTE